MTQTYIKVTKRVDFDASHFLHVESWSKKKNLAYFHKCSKFKPDGLEEPHGHTYHLEVTVEGLPDIDTGFVIDFKKLGKIIKEKALERMDHRLLNNIPYFKGKTTTAENLIQYIWKQLYDAISTDNRRLKQLKLYETPDSFVTYED